MPAIVAFVLRVMVISCWLGRVTDPTGRGRNWFQAFGLGGADYRRRRALVLFWSHERWGPDPPHVRKTVGSGSGDLAATRIQFRNPLRASQSENRLCRRASRRSRVGVWRDPPAPRSPGPRGYDRDSPA